MIQKNLKAVVATILFFTAFSTLAATLTLDIPGQVLCNGRIFPGATFHKLPYSIVAAQCGNPNHINFTFYAGTFILKIGKEFQHAQILSYTPQSEITIAPENAVSEPVSDIIIYYNGVLK
ncbi:MAG: hypothetical protein NTZ67_07575 [Gammaproteobacteria bacterium]|nr:hypothetical protein [Gammaproteobacteria bacterium]